MAIEDHVSNSKFYMLRCLIAMAHADGIVTEEERAYISAILNRLPLSEEQRDTFENDFVKPQNIASLMRNINDPRFRSQVVDFARILSFKDGVMHPNENDLLKKLNADAMDNIDMDAIRTEAKRIVAQEINLHDITIDKNGAHEYGHIIPWFQMFDKLLLKIGIDLIRN